MRVVSGSARGIPLLSVPGDSTRPILDRVKTALFDVLRPQLEGLRVLDLFAGSGSVGIEALSQGASHCTFLDIERAAIQTIHKNLKATRLGDRASVKLTDAFSYLKKTTERFDLVYIAPPQYKGMWMQAMHWLAERPELVAPAGLIIVQIDPHEYEKLELSAFSQEQERRYGSTALVFYRRI
jgi:16S rRNA (guanine966-N2)-methyltransferase